MAVTGQGRVHRLVRWEQLSMPIGKSRMAPTRATRLASRSCVREWPDRECVCVRLKSQLLEIVLSPEADRHGCRRKEPID